jgi:hypothetical protein
MIGRGCIPRAAWLTILLGGCTTLWSWRHASPEESRPATHVEPTTQDVPSGHLGGEALGFVLESGLRARRLHKGKPDMVIQLGSGATVIDGDRLQLWTRTSRDAYLYLAFCSGHANDSRYPGLKVFPDDGALRVRAYETTIAPDRAAEIVLDDQPGQESLYLIFSRIELSRADSALAQVIAAARQGNQSSDCGTPFRAAITGSHGQTKPPKAWSGKPRAASPPGRSRKAKPMDPQTEDDPVIEIQRGGDIIWNNSIPPGVEADPNGIVVLRFNLNHVAAQQ